MSDVNAYLRQIKTAREDDHSAGNALLTSAAQQQQQQQRQRQRRRARDQHDEDDTAATVHSSGGGVVGLDMAQVRAELARDKHERALAHQRSTRVAAVLSACAAATMAHGVVQFVLEREVGGRHNAIATAASARACSNSGSSSHGVAQYEEQQRQLLLPSQAELCVERATLAPAAALALHYVMLPGTASSGDSSSDDDDGGHDTHTHSGSRLLVVTRRAPLSGDVLAYRRALRLCRVRSGADLVGGVTAASGHGGAVAVVGPHIRRHLRRLIEAALRGRQWSREDDDNVDKRNGVDDDHHDDDDDDAHNAKASPTLELFAPCATTAATAADAVTTTAFSLDVFLRGSDSDNASDSEEGDVRT